MSDLIILDKSQRDLILWIFRKCGDCTVKAHGNRKYGRAWRIKLKPADQSPKAAFPHKPSKPRKQRKR